nr:MAG TPA: hypothetical protein [Caudoviricetes sp.]
MIVIIQTLCLAYCGLFTVIFSSTLHPKNSPPDCFLYGLSNPGFTISSLIKKDITHKFG